MSKKKLPKYLTESEQRALFKAIKRGGIAIDELIFSLMLHHGLRLQEALQIRLEDIDREMKGFNVRVKINIKRLKGGESMPHTIKKDDIPLLSRWLRERSELKRADENEYLFITARSGLRSMESSTVQKRFWRYCKIAGIDREKAHTHVLRHTCAVSLLMSGADIFRVQNYLGHADIKSTEIYLRLMPPDWARIQADAVERSFIV